MDAKESISLKEPDPSSSRENQPSGLLSSIEEELRQTVQHLAIQNMHLHTTQQDTEKKLAIALQQVNSCSLSQVQALTEEREANCDTIERLKTELLESRIKTDCKEAGEEMAETDLDRTTEGEESDEEHAEKNKRELERFRVDLGNKREARHRAISAVSAELERLRGELNEEKIAREKAEAQLQEQPATMSRSQESVQQLKDVQEELRLVNERYEQTLEANKHLEGDNEQLSNSLKEETLKGEADKEYSQRRIVALKEVAALSKQMLAIRESQVSDLKGKISHLETLPSGSHTSNAQLQAEYDTQISNIKTLKNLYEDRLRSVTTERDKYQRECADKSEELDVIVKKSSELEIRLAELEKSAEEREDLNSSLQTRLDLSLEESKSLSTEISLINSTFTQMLLGTSSADLDLDKLTKRLQENHDLITEMTTKEDGSGTAASLPKLLLDLINQVNNDETVEEASTSGTQEVPSTEEDLEDANKTSQEVDKVTTHEEGSNSLAVEEIASNLPKVWRVLMELLSHHVVPTPAGDNIPSCYKCIDTPSGPQFVPSVSNTYIRLKDLILEKKSLQKDLGKLKQLNGHLESKLQEQEKRLLLVTAELRKTWSVVGRLRSQFKQLHTHEQILRYELHQKRHLLTELKNELEYCREKWERARQKDRETEVEWKKLRKEFAARKRQDQSNSGESGFSDERENESGDEETVSSPKPLAVSNLASENNTTTDQPQEGCSKVTITELVDPTDNNIQVEIKQGMDEDKNIETDTSRIEKASENNTPSDQPQEGCSKVAITELVNPTDNNIQVEIKQGMDEDKNIETDTSRIEKASENNTPTDQPQEGCSKVTITELVGPTDNNIKVEIKQEINKQKNIETDTSRIEEAKISEAGGSLRDVVTPPEAQSPFTSWMTLLKLFRCENNGMLLEHDLLEDAKALESIFCLPQIQVPCPIVQVASDNSITSDSLHNKQNQLQSHNSHSTMSNPDPGPSTSSTSSSSTVRDALGRTPEEALAARAARLKRLEEQTQMLFKKVTRTTNRSVALSNRLEELHGQYGVPNPPPLPLTIPVLRIPLQDPENNDPSLQTSSNNTEETNNEPDATNVENEDDL